MTPLPMRPPPFGGYPCGPGLVPLPSPVTIHQGPGMGAPNLLLIDLAPGATTVRVTGRATRLAPPPYDDHFNEGRCGSHDDARSHHRHRAH